MYTKNILVLLHYVFSCGKAGSVKYCEGMSVALIIQDAQRKHHIVLSSVAWQALAHSFSLFYERTRLLLKVFEQNSFFILSTKWMFLCLHVNYTLFVTDFSQILIFSTAIILIIQLNLIIHCMGAVLFDAELWTDGRTNAKNQEEISLYSILLKFSMASRLISMFVSVLGAVKFICGIETNGRLV